MRVASSDGVQLELHDRGGDGPALLIAHATGFCGRTYDPLAAALSARLHVWALDFRGHGDSTAPSTGRFEWDAMAEDLTAAIDAIGRAPVHAFGHSMGGATLLLAEAARPGLLASAFLYEPIVLPPGIAPSSVPGSASENSLAGSARRRRPTFSSKAEALYRYASRPPLGVLRADALAAYVEHGFVDVEGGTRLKCDPEHEARTFESANVSVDRVATVGVPVMVAAGQEGGAAMGPARFAPTVSQALPNARLLEYAHLGHFGPLQDPARVGADVAAAIFG